MANELVHVTVGAELAQAEYEGVTAHQFNSQATGDIPYASSATQLSRKAIGAANDVLTVSGGIPAWTGTPVFAGASIGDLTFTEDTAPAGTIVYAVRDNTGDLTLNALTGKTVNVAIAGTDVAQFGGTSLAFQQATTVSNIEVLSSTTSNSIEIYGRRTNSAAGIVLATTGVTPGFAETTRMTVTGTVATAVVTWAACTHTGIVSSGDLIVSDGAGVVVGHTAQITAANMTPEMGIHGTSWADSALLLSRWSNDTGYPTIIMAKSRSATIGTFSIVSSGDPLAQIRAYGDDGVDFNSNGNASVAVVFWATGTIAADRVPGRMTIDIATNAQPSVLTTVMDITATGIVWSGVVHTGFIATNSIRLGTAGSALGTLNICGNTSGVVSVSVAAAAGTWTMTLPSAANTNAGYQLTCAGADSITSWAAAASLREYKDIAGLHSPQDALDRMLGTRVYDFRYKPGMGTQDRETQYVGVVADEAPWAMHYAGGVVNPINALGYTVLAFQAMQAEIDGLKAELVALRAK